MPLDTNGRFLTRQQLVRGIILLRLRHTRQIPLATAILARNKWVEGPDDDCGFSGRTP